MENCSVLDIQTENDSIAGVVTDKGTISTQCVVNCTGVWANHVCEKLGFRIPLVAMKHAYVTTERMEGVEGMPNIRDHDASVYLKVQGDVLHIGGYENNPIFLEEVFKLFTRTKFKLKCSTFSICPSAGVKKVCF